MRPSAALTPSRWSFKNSTPPAYSGAWISVPRKACDNCMGASAGVELEGGEVRKGRRTKQRVSQGQLVHNELIQCGSLCPPLHPWSPPYIGACHCELGSRL